MSQWLLCRRLRKVVFLPVLLGWAVNVGWHEHALRGLLAQLPIKNLLAGSSVFKHLNWQRAEAQEVPLSVVYLRVEGATKDSHFIIQRGATVGEFKIEEQKKPNQSAGQAPSFELRGGGPAGTYDLVLKRSDGVFRLLLPKQQKLWLHVKQGKLSLASGEFFDLKILGEDLVVDANKAQGELSLHSKKAQVDLVAWAGSLQLDVFQGLINITQSEGKLSLRSYKGQQNIVDYKGRVHFSGFDNETKFLNGQVRLNFELSKGQLSVSKVGGSIVGFNQAGQIEFSNLIEPIVDIKSQAGRVSLLTNKEDSPFLHLVTSRGDIRVPPSMKLVRTAGVKMCKGRMGEKLLKGQFKVVAEEGSIVVR